MKIRLTNIKSEGMENIPYLDIKFEEKKDISFFMGHNGFGKSSIFMAIISVLSGDFMHLNEIDEQTGIRQNLGEKDLIKIYKGSKDSSHGRFEVAYSVDDNYWKVGMQLDYINNKFKFFHTHPKKGYDDDHMVDERVSGYFKQQFIDLIFFDPIRVKHIFIKGSMYNTEKCIEKFCGIDKVKSFVEDIKIFAKNKRNQISSTQTRDIQSKINELEKQKEAAEKNLEKSKKDLQDLIHQESVKQEEYNVLHNKYEKLFKKDEETLSKQKQIDKELSKNQSDQQEKLRNVFEVIVNKPYTFSENYKQGITKLINVFDDHQIQRKTLTILLKKY